jgi:hypothetical protein
MKLLLGKLTYANVMATVAVFIALGGASYAAVSLPKNSVGANQIKDRAIGTSKLKGGAVTAPNIAKEAVTGSKLKLSTLGTVPSAEHATSADNTQSLGGATAGQIVGRAVSISKLRCPAGTIASTGVCFGPVQKATGWYEAIDVCAEDELTLPTPAQLHAFGKVHNPVGADFEWTGDALTPDESLKMRSTPTGMGAVSEKVFGSSLPFHCVGNPTA